MEDVLVDTEERMHMEKGGRLARFKDGSEGTPMDRRGIMTALVRSNSAQPLPLESLPSAFNYFLQKVR